MISHTHQTRSNLSPSTEFHFLYSTRLPSPTPDFESSDTSGVHSVLDQILFLPRLREIVRAEKRQQQQLNTQGLTFQPLDVRLHLTNLSTHTSTNAIQLAAELNDEISLYDRRITVNDLKNLIGDDKDEQTRTVCNVCGPPRMTDELVEALKGIIGVGKVFYEKWW